ncbi:MAG TPA: T9SS type A sorting domain-containing protein, partial [Chitinophagales bacterium]|nr:T9SS type A sorting domain-containing protein [Chitinophagales bacterium]
RITEVTEFDAIADREHFIVAYPTGVDTAWNCFGNPHTGVDDIGFLSALIDTLHEDYHIDLNRVYFTGMSNGGFMCYSAACLLGHRVAAIASVAGSTTDSMLVYCQPSRAMPIMHIHGDADWIVNYNGSFVGGLGGNNSVDSSLQYWVQYNNCPSSPAETMLPDADETDGCTVRKILWAPCDNGSEIIHYRVIDGGHTWPGSPIDFNGWGGNANNDFKASEVIWEFFSQYTLQGKVTTSVNEASENFVFTVEPNPADDVLKVRGEGMKSMKLNDLSGKVIFHRKIENHAHTVSIAMLSSGMYFVVCEFEKEIRTFKIVKR